MFNEVQVGNARFQLEHDPTIVQLLLQRPDQRVVLVVNRAGHAIQAIQPRNHRCKSQNVAAKLRGTVPRLKGECRAPHHPDVGFEKTCSKNIGNRQTTQHRLRLRRYPLDLENIQLAQSEGRRSVALAFDQQTRLLGRLHPLIPRQCFGRHRCLAIKHGHGGE
jgi:hypothetical protein